MNYQRIWCKIWDDPKFRKLSDIGKLTFLNLLINKNGNLMGFFVLRRGYAMEDLDKKEVVLDGAMSEILKQDMISYDASNALLLIKNYLKHNPIQTEDKITAASRALEILPHSELIYEFRDLLDTASIRGKGKNEDLIPIVDRLLRGIGKEDPEDDNGKEGEAVVHKPRLNVEGVVETWNQICVPILPQVMSIPTRRHIAIKSRLVEHPDLDEWRDIFSRVTKSPFLIGENDRGWKASFDWVMKPTNLTKIVEGNYDQVSNPNKPKTGMDAVRAMAEEALPRNQMAGGEDDEGNLPQGDSLIDESF
ncbi:MAG: hypothetical protein O8C67_10715 [Candidatus Methanoperedens sp.]|nr:hypothetical protein [Candidatus Methanoperedens sp.]